MSDFEQQTIGALNFGEEFDKANYELIDDGKYEVTIAKVDKKVSKNGKNYLNFVLKIRPEANAKFGNRNLFYRVNEKEGDVCYDFNRINKIIITQKDTDNYKKYFLDVDEVLQYLTGLHLVVTVETVFDEFSNADRNVVKDWSFEPSVWDKQDHSAAATETTAELELPDDNTLPF